MVDDEKTHKFDDQERNEWEDAILLMVVLDFIDAKERRLFGYKMWKKVRIASQAFDFRA